MSKSIGIIIGIVVIIGGIYLLGRAPKTSDVNLNENNVEDIGGDEENLPYETSKTTTTNPTSTPQKTTKITTTTGTQGRVVFSITDAIVDMRSISEVNLKVSKIEIHSSTSGWTTVPIAPQTYDLVSLNKRNKSELLADMGVKSGTFDQIRLTMDSVNLKSSSGITREAKLPSRELKINTNLVITKNAVSSVNFDFLADKSLHVTGKGEYIFAPVVSLKIKSGASVSVNPNSTVDIIGGITDNATMVGMDVDGTVKINFQISSTQELSIDSSGKIKLEGLLQ
jgi:hypothetical protein